MTKRDLRPRGWRVRTSIGSPVPESTTGTIALRLTYRPPLAWDALLRYLQPRAIPGVEQVSGDTYRRTLSIHGVDGDRLDY